MSNTTVIPEIQPLLTVALPVLNGGSQLALSVASVLNQSFTNWELFIMDDGSTDGAIDTLPIFFDPRIYIIKDGCNRGLSSRLNQAVSMANGKYFARMDHDDICHPERFSRQVAYLENHSEIDLLGTQCITIDENDCINGILPSANDHEEICLRPWLGFYIPHPTWMGRLEWFRHYPYREPAPYCCEDQDLLLRAYESSRYHTLPDRLLAYRIRSHTLWQKLLRTRIAMLRIQSEYFLSKKQWDDAALSAAMAIARIGRDSWRELQHLLNISGKFHQGEIVPKEEFLQWNLIIQNLKLEKLKAKTNQS